MRYEELTRRCIEFRLPQYQYITSLVDRNGDVWLKRSGWKRLQKEERLKDLLPSHDVILMSRVEWFVERPDFAEVPNLYRRNYGSREVIEVEDGPIYDVFEEHFRDYRGYSLSEAEQANADAESTETLEHLRRCAADQGIRGL